MVMKRRNYEAISEILYRKAAGMDRQGWRDRDKKAGKKCFNNHCDITKTMADRFEKEDDKFDWRDFMSGAGCFGRGKKKLQEEMK